MNETTAHRGSDVWVSEASTAIKAAIEKGEITATVVVTDNKPTLQIKASAEAKDDYTLHGIEEYFPSDKFEETNTVSIGNPLTLCKLQHASKNDETVIEGLEEALNSYVASANPNLRIALNHELKGHRSQNVVVWANSLLQNLTKMRMNICKTIVTTMKNSPIKN